MLLVCRATCLCWVLSVCNGMLAEEPAGADSIRRLDGFQVELLRVAKADEDSWISMCFDDRGRIYLGLDRVGVARLDLLRDGTVTYRRLDQTLKHCRGILYAHHSLYVNSTDGRKLVRFNDQDRDGELDSQQVLLNWDYRSRYGHGANQLRLGPDGKIYVAVGNDVAFPANTLKSSPYRNPRNDWLLPDAGDLGQDDRVGYILRIDKDGQNREVLAGGFRNQVDLAFNSHGEMFTFDADMEWDIGAPWYRPIRINHIVSGGEYGWRWGTGKWHNDYPDSLPSNLDVGMGSPTGVVFGTQGKFPEKYRRALFIADWQNGKILAAHQKSAGASYVFELESFLEGAPLNVCDMEFGPDGQLYFITGGRGSQSALYRVSWQGNELAAPGQAADKKIREIGFTAAQRRRREIERRFHTKTDPTAVENVWPELSREDPWLRFAARIALENQPVSQWEKKVFAEDARQALYPLLALVRQKKTDKHSSPEFQARVAKKLQEGIQQIQTQRKLRPDEMLVSIRICTILFARHGRPTPELAHELVKCFGPIYPQTNETINGELIRLMVYLDGTTVVDQAFDLLATQELSQEAQIHIAKSLGHRKRPWTDEQNQDYAKWLARARSFRGGHLLPKTIAGMQRDFLKQLDAEQQESLTRFIDQLAQPSSNSTHSAARAFVKNWQKAQLGDLELNQANRKQGRILFLQAQCANCHRKNELGTPIGPDLSNVAGRFGPQALLESILEPSRQIDPKYALSTYALTNGKTYTGRVHGVNGKTITLEVDPLTQATIQFERNEIEQTKAAKTSPMPTGLLDTMTKDEIQDLLAFLLDRD